MPGFLWYLVLPMLVTLIAVGITAVSGDWRSRLTRYVLGCAASVLVLCAGHLAALLLFSAATFTFPPLVIVTVSIGMLLPFTCSRADEARRPMLCRFLKTVGVLTVLCLIVELFVFNINSLSVTPDMSTLSLDRATVSGAATLRGNTIVFHKTNQSDKGEAILPVSLNGVRAVGLRFAPCTAPVEITVGIKDDNAREKFIDVAKRNIPTDGGEWFVPIDTFGTLHELRIQVYDINEPFAVEQIDAATHVPLSVSAARFFVVWLVVVGIAAVKIGGLYRLDYNSKKLSHKTYVGVCFLLCIGISIMLLMPYFVPSPAVKEAEATLTDGDVASIDYPFEEGTVPGRDPYAQQFDAFEKGQLHIDMEVDPKLIAFDAPYDDSARATLQIYYPWDRAYYDGHYYSYFGLAPLTFYYPYHAITGALPRIPVACGFFALVAIAALFAVILRTVKRFCGKVNLLLLLLLLVTSCAVSGIWWLQIMATQYALPILSGLAFLFLTVWLGFFACDVQNRVVQPVLFALCGVSAVLTVLSRPTMLLCALLLAPAFIGFLCRHDLSIRRKTMNVLSFLVPVGAGAFMIMSLNNARFGSPFEFGATYQLTVSNIAANTLSLSLIPSALFHYGFQLPVVDLTFPFIHPGSSRLNNYGRYTFNEYAVGVFTFPHIAAAVCSLPAVVKRSWKRHPVKCFTLLLVPLLTVALIVLDFCMAGVTLRYTVDCLPALLIAAVPLLLEAYHRLGRLPRMNDRHFPLFAAVLILSLLMGLGITLHLATFETGAQYHAQLLTKLEDTLAFWR